jgi:hypothetical protein
LGIKHFATTSFLPSRPVEDENKTNFTSAKIEATISDVALKTTDTEDSKTMRKEQVTSFPATEIMAKNIQRGRSIKYPQIF